MKRRTNFVFKIISAEQFLLKRSDLKNESIQASKQEKKIDPEIMFFKNEQRKLKITCSSSIFPQSPTCYRLILVSKRKWLLKKKSSRFYENGGASLDFPPYWICRWYLELPFGLEFSILKMGIFRRIRPSIFSSDLHPRTSLSSSALPRQILFITIIKM